jgi:hypothetical protein
MSGWSVPIDRLVANAKEDLHTVVRKSTFHVFRSVVLRSPVDTGRFRANWNASFGAPEYTTTVSTNEGRGITEASKALSFPVGGVAYLSNGLAYAVQLEHGYSKQAPAGMVKLAAAEFARFVQGAAK